MHVSFIITRLGYNIHMFVTTSTFASAVAPPRCVARKGVRKGFRKGVCKGVRKSVRNGVLKYVRTKKIYEI